MNILEHISHVFKRCSSDTEVKWITGWFLLSRSWDVEALWSVDPEERRPLKNSSWLLEGESDSCNLTSLFPYSLLPGCWESLVNNANYSTGVPFLIMVKWFLQASNDQVPKASCPCSSFCDLWPSFVSNNSLHLGFARSIKMNLSPSSILCCITIYFSNKKEGLSIVLTSCVCAIGCVCTLMCVMVGVLALCHIGGGQRKILVFAFQLAWDRTLLFYCGLCWASWPTSVWSFSCLSFPSPCRTSGLQTCLLSCLALTWVLEIQT